MKQYVYIYAVGSLALAMGTLPAVVAHADYNSMSGGASANTSSDTQGGETSASTSISAQAGMGGEKSSGDQHKKQGYQTTEATTSLELQGEVHATSTERALEEVALHAAEQAREHSKSRLFLELESTTTQAFSFAQLQQMIGMRKQELNQEEASTTLADRNIVKNADEVRLAVHALLAAKPLLGGIGQRVSQIAQKVDASVATTTNAQAQIQARGFLMQFLFGGDSAAAMVIKDEVAQNQQHIQELTQLLNQANLSVDVQTTLKVQIAAMEVQQTNLSNLAQKEQSQWGIFSWRF
ncbi:hypothetical protein HKL94_02365 [Candidatus Parcubacteria bacterium]|nr:hypothetical protein [Candidatus Parcubacteria bacterium]